MEMLVVTNPCTQLLLLIGTGILCLIMFLRFNTSHFRPHKNFPVVAARNKPGIPSVVQLPRAPVLQIGSIVQHGRIVEIHGSTEPGAVVMINGQPAVIILSEGEFRHFVGPLPAGTSAGPFLFHVRDSRNLCRRSGSLERLSLALSTKVLCTRL